MSDAAKLDLGTQTVELPIIEGSEGEKAIDISALRSQTGFITIDPGYGNTGSCTSGITFLNGEVGILKYRGVPIEVLAERSNFLEVSYLLAHGGLPKKAELEHFSNGIKKHSHIPSEILDMVKCFPKTAHPMGVMSAITSALSGFNDQLLTSNVTDEQKEESMSILLGQLPVIAAAFYRHSQSKEFIPPREDLDYVSNFLNMLFGDDGYVVDPEVARALDILLILHGDHEQNCSASTVRMVGSSKANIFATISAGIDALWGPLHGGANQAVLEMLAAIQEDGGDYKKFLAKAKDKEDPFKLMGFGHRVYKNFDPRAKIIKSACDTILNKLGVKDPILDIAKGLEEQALVDKYFVDRKLYPNVDFYSGIIYKALGIPVNMFTVMFILGRIPGWFSQWKELIEDPKMRICRPRQIYTGNTTLNYSDIGER